MSKPNWACSGCGMYSSRRWSVERHILNLHGGISNVVPFVDYLIGRKSGFYLPKFRLTFVKKNATKTVTVMDTFKDELLKGFASKAINKAQLMARSFYILCYENKSNSESTDIVFVIVSIVSIVHIQSRIKEKKENSSKKRITKK